NFTVTQSVIRSTTGGATGTSDGLLPDITDSVTIDGLVGGSFVNVLLLSKTSADPVSGFHVTGNAANSTIRNLNIMDAAGPGNFAGKGEFGILVDAAGGGLTVQSVTIQGVDGEGIRIQGSPNNTIGGDISSRFASVRFNGGAGIHISGAASTGNLIEQ